MTETAQPILAPASTSKKIKVALFLSLALNLLLVGLIAGAMVAGHRQGRMMARDVGFGPLTAALTREDRGALRKSFVQANPDRDADRAAMASDFSALVAALKLDPWDQAAVMAALTRQGARSQARLAQGRDILMAHIAKMTAADRSAFAARIEKALARGAESTEVPAAP